MTTIANKPTSARRYAGLSPEQRTARRRAQFMAAGRVLFGGIGYRRTTVRLLCREAGLTDRYFYESFASVEALLVAVYEQMIDDMRAAIVAAIQQAAQPSAPLEALVDAGLEAFFREAEDPLVSRVLWIEILGVSPGADAVYNLTLRRFGELLHGLIRAMLPALRTSDEVARVLVTAVIGAASEAAKDWMLSGYQQPRETLVHGVSLLIRGVVALAGAGQDEARST